MPTPITETSEGGQSVEWSETFHAFLFRARIYLKRFGWIILITMGVGALVQVWKTRDIPPVYTSQGEMQVRMQISGSSSAGANVNEPTLNYFATQQHNIMTNDRLRKKAYDEALKQMPDPNPTVKPWASHTADFLQGTLILHFSATGGDPEFTRLYLQELMEEYLAGKEQQRQLLLKSYGTTLESVGNSYDKDIQDLMAQRDEFVSKNNLTDLSTAIDNVDTKLRKLSEQQSEMEAQLTKLLTDKKPDSPLLDAVSTPVLALPQAVPPAASGAAPAVTEPGNMKIHTFVVPEVGEQKPLNKTEKYINYIAGTGVDFVDSELASVGLLPVSAEYQEKKDTQAQLRIRLEQLTHSGLADGHPKLIRLRADLASVDTYLQILRTQRVDKLEGLKASLEQQLKDDQEQEKQLVSTVTDYRYIKKKLDNFDYRIKSYEDRQSKTIADTVALPQATQLDQELLYISSDASPGQLVPQNPSKQISQGAFVGFALGVVIVFLLGAIDGRVMSVEDLTQRFDEPMLGVIPMQKRLNGQVELLKNNDQRQMFAESCRNIRSSLLYMDRQGQRPRVIMLTSSMPSEGKSTLSANLSITLGFASSRTLLVDADMRRGQLHKRFGLKNDAGLAEHIKDGLSLDQVIQKTGSENLDFISCGKYPTQPGELLMSERFRESIQTLRQRYDFVLFDSPPILLTDDAASFATRADAVIFVVRAGYTRMRQVRTSLESLNRRGVNVYGIVVNFIDHREPGYYSYRYYDYYSYRPGRPS